MSKVRRGKTRLRLLAAVLAVSTIATSNAFAGTWRQVGTEWQYHQDNGVLRKDQWFKDVDGVWYHFDVNGIMQTGWFKDVDGIWYFLETSGAMAVSKWILDANGKWYYVTSNGAMKTNGYTPDGYKVNPDGSWNELAGRIITGDSDDSSGSSSGGNSGGEDPGGEDPGGEDPGGEDPGGEDPGGEDPGGEDPGGEEPGGEDPEDKPETAIKTAANLAENAGAVTSNTIEFLTGRTYRYTVDSGNSTEAGLTTTEVGVTEFIAQIKANLSSDYQVQIKDSLGNIKSGDVTPQSGDRLVISDKDEEKQYTIQVKHGALRGTFEATDDYLTVGSQKDLIMNFHAGQRTPNGTVIIDVPAGITVDGNNTYVNVIGRGEVPLDELSEQSPGRWGGGYEVRVGNAQIENQASGGTKITLTGLDLRPDNGIDLQIRIESAEVAAAGIYSFQISYQVTEPETAISPVTVLDIKAVPTVTSFTRVLDKSAVYKVETDYQAAGFSWAELEGAERISLMYSLDKGKSWDNYTSLSGNATEAGVDNLLPGREYWFRLDVSGGAQAGSSNVAKFYSGMYNVRTSGGAPTDGADAAPAIDAAIDYLNSIGGGTVLFEGGTFDTTTVHLKSNVYLYIDKTAELRAMKGCDAPEVTWFSDKDYRSGTSPTSEGPYRNGDNWLSKQDVGHTYWQNAMFYGQRLDNIKIIGNGRIAGNGNLNTSDGVMNNSADNRADKMVALKLCTNFEMGGLSKPKDLWYEETSDPNNDQPFYLEASGARDEDISNMLRISRAGHFVLLATGVDGVNTHDVYAEKSNGGVRDIFDYMACSDVVALNIYAEGSSDDIVKPGSDCSLGFTRPVSNYLVRNIIGDTNCNLFQIGSETADDIQNICVDNIYVLASNKAGFSISTNDGGHIKDIHLNCGGTVGECKYGVAHEGISLSYRPDKVHPYRSQMRRTRAPFFLSISNRGRIMGGKAVRKNFVDANGTTRDELLSTNVNIGYVENIFINDINVEEVYGGSQYQKTRWVEYSNQNKATPIIAGYKVPEGVGITLPDGRDVGYLENVEFNNVDVLVKGGNPISDASNSPKEMGVGQYNVGDLAGDARGSNLPSYGFWARHVKGFNLTDCSVNYEKNDDRFAIVLDDVEGASLTNVKMVQPENNRNVLELLNCIDFSMKDSVYFEKQIDGPEVQLPELNQITIEGKQTYPYEVSESVVIVKNEQAEKNVVEAIEEENHQIQVLYGAEAAELLASIKAEDESAQEYLLYRDSESQASVTGKLMDGDVLKVTSESRKNTVEYSIKVNLSKCVTMQMKDEDGCVIVINNETKKVTVITGTTVEELKEAVRAEDFSEQSYSIDGKEDADLIDTNDTLVVQAADGVTEERYLIVSSEDIRIRIVEDTYFVQAINTSKNTITVLRGTTPQQLKDSIIAKREDIELVFAVESKSGEAKEKGEVTEEDQLVVTLGGSLSDSQIYKISTTLFSSDSILAEGEKGTYVITGASMTSKTNTDTKASGGSNRQFENCAVNDYVEYTIPNVPAGMYELVYTYKTANNNRRGIMGASFNGVEAEGEADANDTVANLYQSFSYGMVRQQEKGDAVVTLTVVEGGSGSAPYNFIVDCLQLKGNPSPNTNLIAKGTMIIEIDNDEKTIVVKRNTEVEDILKVTSADGSGQTHSVIRGGDTIESGLIEETDVLKVVAQDKEHVENYTIVIDDTVVSKELTFATPHWLTGKLRIEPGTQVSDLESLITADVSLGFEVTSKEGLKEADEVIYSGDKIEILDNDDLDEVLSSFDADVYFEIPFAAHDEEGVRQLSAYVVASASDATFAASDDSIITGDKDTVVPYGQVSKKAGAKVVLEAEVPAEGRYKVELVYKGGNRSKEVQADIICDGQTLATKTLSVADVTGTLWLDDLPGRNLSKTYMIKPIATINLEEGSIRFNFEDKTGDGMVLVEVRLTLLEDNAEEETDKTAKPLIKEEIKAKQPEESKTDESKSDEGETDESSTDEETAN